MKHVIESQQFTPETLSELFDLADEMRKNPKKYSQALVGRLIATVFYEPSTRTRLSFESAMLRLGGEIISTENAKEFSSAIKGESIEDTARIIGSYADAIVIRHHEEGTAARAAAVSPVPVINAGDGKGQHPTQALLDTYTIRREIGRLDNVSIALVGDLASGRTVRSLCYIMAKYPGTKLAFVSPPHLKMRDDIKEHLERHNVKFVEETGMNNILPAYDIIYMTRIQKERMSAEEYESAKGKYVIDENNLGRVRKNARIMHPLPHVEEISIPIAIETEDPRIAYFRQAENGLWIRMALLHKILSRTT
jgi:aspartate carbamoyltransferase catalytic subunit